MPCIWGQHNGSQLFLIVAIIPSQSGPSIAAAPEGDVYAGPISALTALVDTGATTTCLSRDIAKALNFQPVGKTQVHGVGGLVDHNRYLFYVGFPVGMTTQPVSGLPPPTPGQFTANVHILSKLIQGSEFDGGNAPFQVLLGMDVISTGSLIVQGNGTFSFSF